MFLDQTLPRDYRMGDIPFSEKAVSGTLRQFIENAESGDNRKTLRVVRMPSEASPSQTPFGSEFVAWRETKLRVYCQEEDISLIKSLLWYDIATEHSAQWWTLTPYGLGVCFDVRAGSQWVVIATPPNDIETSDHYFAQPKAFLPTFRRTNQHPNVDTNLEAVHLTQGMRMYVYYFAKRCTH